MLAKPAAIKQRESLSHGVRLWRLRSPAALTGVEATWPERRGEINPSGSLASDAGCCRSRRPIAARSEVRLPDAGWSISDLIPLGRFHFVILLLSIVLGTRVNAEGTGYVFISNEDTNNITVLDSKLEYRIIKWIPTAHRPGDLNFRNGGKQLLVACAGDDVIDVIDVATLGVTGHIPTGSNPTALQLSRNGDEFYVPNQERSTVQEINIAEKIISREFATGAEPKGLALSGDGRMLYVTSDVDDLVHVIDLDVGAVMHNIAVGTRPTHILLLPNKNELWVSNELSGQVSIIDRSTNKAVGNLEFLPPGYRQHNVTPAGMTMTENGKTAIVALGRANHVAFVDAVSRRIANYVPVGRWAREVALSPDEKTLYVVNAQSDDLSIVDVESRRAIGAVPVGGSPHSVLVDN
jgi:YVTN family beta-propeller protein